MKSDLVLGDSLVEIKKISTNTIDLILTDIPYGISFDSWDVLHSNQNSALGGQSPAQEKSSSFKRRGKPIKGWSKADQNISTEYYQWCKQWSPDFFRVLKEGASCFIFTGRRYSHQVIRALEEEGFLFRDMLAWVKPSANHKAQRLEVYFSQRGDVENEQNWKGWRIGNLRPIFEPILWLMKPYKKGLVENILENELGGFHQEAFLKFQNDDNVLECPKEELGDHPTQKPLYILESLIELTTKEGHLVLDPFMGSGSTCVAAKKTNRSFLGIEKDSRYYKKAEERISAKTPTL